MKNHRSFKQKYLILLLGTALVSCTKDVVQESQTLAPVSDSTNKSARIAAVVEHPGRALAANCFQCHGTNGYGLEHLAGKSASEIANELIEMKAKNPREDIMNVHAQAYTNEEIKLIADFFSKQ